MHKLSKQKTHHQVTFSSLSQIHFSPLFLELASCDGMRWSNRTFWLLCAASLGLVLLFSRIFAENYGSISFTTCWLGIPVLPVKHSYRFLYEPWMALGWYTLHTYMHAKGCLFFRLLIWNSNSLHLSFAMTRCSNIFRCLCVVRKMLCVLTTWNEFMSSLNLHKIANSPDEILI